MINTNKALEEAILLAEQLAEKLQEANQFANAEKTKEGALLSILIMNEIRPTKELENRLALANLAHKNEA